jgi:hypothetical protein
VTPVDEDVERLTVTRLVLLAAGTLAAQAVVSGLGTSSAVGTWLWFAAGAGLLWLVHAWHSRAAQVVLVVVSAVGVLLTGIATTASDLPLGRGLLLTLAYAGTAWLLTRRAVRRHVRHAPER